MNTIRSKQGGFSIGLVIILVILIGLISFVGWRIWSHNQQQKSNSEQSSNENQQSSIPEGYKRYDDPKARLSFIYPNNWETKATNLDGAIIGFIRPSLKEAINKGMGPSGADFYEGPNFSLVVSYWGNINEVLKDENYTGKRNYSNLSDFLNDQHAPVEKLGEIMVNGTEGYEVINKGSSGQYALLFERHDGVYQVEFSDVAEKTGLSAEDKKVVESFRFQ